jgi:hypothetical protein
MQIIPRSTQRRLGIRWLGAQPIGNGRALPMYDDLVSGSTFLVRLNETVAEAVERIRRTNDR